MFVKDERVIQIEGDPDSPISRGRLCSKGSASKQLVTSRAALTGHYRRPYGTEWEDLPLDQAMDMIADRVIATRAATGRTTTTRAGGSTAPWPWPASAGRPSTTKRTT